MKWKVYDYDFEEAVHNLRGGTSRQASLLMSQKSYGSTPNGDEAGDDL
jgi:hypothetical protein